MNFHLYSLKVSTNVKIALQCFENFGGGKCPPPIARLIGGTWAMVTISDLHTLPPTILPTLHKGHTTIELIL